MTVEANRPVYVDASEGRDFRSEAVNLEAGKPAGR